MHDSKHRVRRISMADGIEMELSDEHPMNRLDEIS
jgi:hypothetical protein